MFMTGENNRNTDLVTNPEIPERGSATGCKERSGSGGSKAAPQSPTAGTLTIGLHLKGHESQEQK